MPGRVRTMPLRDIDPTISIGHDIVKFVLDWISVNRINKIDKIEINLRSSKVKSNDLEQFLGTLFFETPLEKTPVVVKQIPMRYRCTELHTIEKENCHICGTGARDLPSIELRIRSKKGSVELKI